MARWRYFGGLVAAMVVVSVTGCSSPESGSGNESGLYKLGADMCAPDTVVSVGSVNVQASAKTSEKDGKTSQSCTFGVQVKNGERIVQGYVSVSATLFETKEKAAEEYQFWHGGAGLGHTDAQDMAGLGAAAFSHRQFGSFEVITQDDNLMVQVGWGPDRKFDNPADLTARLRQVAQSALVKLRRPDAPPLQTASAQPDPVTTTPSVAMRYRPVKNLCEAVTFTPLGKVVPSTAKHESRDLGSFTSMQCTVRFASGQPGQISQAIVIAQVTTRGGDQAQAYAVERGSGAARASDLPGLGAGAFLDRASVTAPKLVTYDHNLLLTVQWIATGVDVPTDIRQRLIKVAQSVLADL
jgi:hypothetical protein